MKKKIGKKTRKKLSRTATNTVLKRKQKQKEAVAYLKKLNKQAMPNYCIVCGEPNQYCLDVHHPEGRKKNPKFKIKICASCHRVFDKGGGLKQLKERRKRYYKYNLSLRKIHNK